MTALPPSSASPTAVPHAAARMTSSVAEPIPSGVATYVTFNAVTFDTGAFSDLAHFNARLTIPRPGLYIIGGTIEWAANGVGSRTLELEVNGLNVIAMDRVQPVAGAPTVHSLSELAILATGDILRLRATQDCGGPLNIDPTNTSPKFWIAEAT